MEEIKLFSFILSTIGILIMLIAVLYKKIILLNKDDKRNEYADIGTLEGLFIFLYGLVLYFYLPNEKLRIAFVIVFTVLQTVILVYRKNAVYWLTARITAIGKIISTKETKADTVYWMYTIMIIVIIVILSLPFWINPDYPHKYLAMIFSASGTLLYIRSFLFKNNEGRISLYDFFGCLALICLARLFYLSSNEGFTVQEGKMLTALFFIIFKREPPKNSNA